MITRGHSQDVNHNTNHRVKGAAMTTNEQEPVNLDKETQKLIAEIGRQFYLNEKSKIEIAKTLKISRFRVARLLELGKKSKIIKITITEPSTNLNSVSNTLSKHLNLKSTRVIESSGSESQVRDQLGEMAANYLSHIDLNGKTVGVSWGRTLAAMTNYLPRLPFSRIVQLTGTVGWDISQSPVEIIRRMNDLSEAETFALFTPFYVGEAADFIKNQFYVKSVIEMFDEIDVAILSVGSWTPLESQLPQTFPEEVKTHLSSKGTRAEVAGIFLNDDGEVVSSDISDQCITIKPSQLRNIPRVIAVAGSPRKTQAIYALSKSGLITDLITDMQTAADLLQMPTVEKSSYNLPRVPR